MAFHAGLGAPLTVALAVSAAACFAVDFQDGAIACGEAGCPNGLSCGADGYCYRNPGDGDLPPDGPVADPDRQPPCAGSFDVSFCSALPRLPAAPVIDGQLDCGAPVRAVSPVYWDGPELASAPLDHSAEISFAWRPGGIYVYARVYEPELDPAQGAEPVFLGDAIEIYLDDDGYFDNAPFYDTAGTRQLVAAAPELDGPEARGSIFRDRELIASWGSESFIAIPTSFGYVIEAFVRTERLGTPGVELVPGAFVGLNLAVNVSRDGAGDTGLDDYLGQYFLSVATAGFSPWPADNVDAFCRAELVVP